MHIYMVMHVYLVMYIYVVMYIYLVVNIYLVMHMYKLLEHWIANVVEFYIVFCIYIYHCDSVVLFCGMNVHPGHESTVASKVRIFWSNPPP